MSQLSREELTELFEVGSSRQKLRALQSRELLDQYGAPKTPAIYIRDEATAVLRNSTEVARRAVCVYASILRAEGVPSTEVDQILDLHGARSSMTERESKLLESQEISSEDKWYYGWSNERLLVLMWALGKIGMSPWPQQLCEVPRVVAAIESGYRNESFYTKAELRALSVVLNQLDLTMRINWILKDSFLHEREVPANLNWKDPSSLVLLSAKGHNPAALVAGVVTERHKTLLWLISAQNGADWDSVRDHT